MSAFKDITNQRFGRLVAVTPDKKHPYWQCQCDCGQIAVVDGNSLRAGRTRSCGCWQREIVDLAGQRFGRLTAVAPAGKYRKMWRWLCQCDCGQTTVVGSASLRAANTLSCGCLKRDMQFVHGAAKPSTVEYRTYHDMLQRCYNPNNDRFKDYGGRGIAVCERWRGENGFANFLADMGLRPAGRSLDRWPDNDGNYEPGNCRWATAKEQANNRRSSKICLKATALAPSGCARASIPAKTAWSTRSSDTPLI